MPKQKSRLHRQFAAIGRAIPPARGMIHSLLHGRLRMVRLPVACLLILGGLLSVLPVLGLWMLPLGLLLLAVDVPRLRPYISNLLIRVRRRLSVWQHGGRQG